MIEKSKGYMNERKRSRKERRKDSLNRKEDNIERYLKETCSVI